MNNANHNNDTVLYPLTHPQKRIWYMERIYPGTSLYNIGGSIRIKGNIDFCVLEESINILIKKNEGLRLSLIEENGQVKQYVRDYERVNLDYVDMSKYENPEKEFNNWIAEKSRKPFSIDNGRLFYFAMFKISEKDNGYLVKLHHIISDGWSMNILTKQICNNYMMLLNREEIDECLESSYIEYILNENKYLSSERFLKNKAYWNEKFKELPDKFLNISSDKIDGKRKTFELGTDLSSEIKEFSAENKISLNTFFVAVYLLYVYKATLHEDIVIGTPVLNRSGKKEKSMFGMFTSTMPFRFAIDVKLNALETIIKVNEGLLACYFNQKYPYDLLVQDLELKKKGYDNLFNTCINYYNTKLNSELNGFPIENVEFYNGNQIYSMQLIIRDWSDSGSLILDFDYKINDYSDEQVDDIYERIRNLIGQVLKNPYERVVNLSLLSEDEIKKLLYGFNATEAEYPKEKAIYRLFEEQVEKTPDKVAVRFNNNAMTYRELNRKANQLARYLVEKGVKQDSIVALLTTHSIETVIGILGVLKAGGAYLPIDPGYPDERMRYMLEDANVSILLTQLTVVQLFCNEKLNGSKNSCIVDRGQLTIETQNTETHLPTTNNKLQTILYLDDKSIYSGDASNLDVINKPDDLVYIIYTSGSTGKPKGTMIEHQGLVNYIWWARKMYVKNDDEVFPLYSSLAFDLTVTSIFTPLISGSEIIVYRDSEEEEYALYRIMKENRATVVKLTPSQLALLKDMDNKKSSVRRFIVGGEDLKSSLSRDIHESFGGNIEIYNEYGPTETVVGCMIHKYDYERDTRSSVPIGIPTDNVQIYILDNNGNPAPANTIGEMYISGDGVARGYLNRAELTHDKFIENPFIAGRKMYKTGDLARFLSSGKIEYVGRADQQVKIRGYRIEMGEIEKYILSHEAIKDAVVVDIEDMNSSKVLCAYIVKKVEVSAQSLKDYLLRHLPDYMVPVFFIGLDEIPLTINGKLNRNLLPKPEADGIEETEFVEYRNENEKQLVNAVCEVLNLEKVSVRQNFYHLGGDSIKAIQIASKLNDKGLKIKVKDILSNPIIEEMALYLEKNAGVEINQEPCAGSIISTPIVYWFFAQNFANPNHYNQSILLELEQGVETGKLETILKELIRHHDSLRINYDSRTGGLFYNNQHLDRHYSIPEYDLTGMAYSEQVEKMTCIASDLKSSLDLEKDILIKACVFNLEQNKRRMLITAHHLVVDGVSWRIIIEDINSMLNRISCGQGISLPSKTHSYQEWAKTLEKYTDTEVEDEKNYWNNILSKDFCFPADINIGNCNVGSSYTLKELLPEDLTDLLLTKANSSYNTEPKDLLIASLLRTIKESAGSEDIIIELEGHGREDVFEHTDVTRTVGWFTNLYPFYVKLGNEDLGVQIKEIKEELRRIPNKGIGFGILSRMLKEINEDRRKYIRFNYLGDFTYTSGNDSVKLLNEQLENESSKENSLTYIIEVNCFIVDGRLNILLTYSRNMFSENSMKKFISSFIMNIREAIEHCCDKGTVEFTPSDFDTVDISFEDLDSLFS